MSLKAELETWDKALEKYDAQEFDAALEMFETIADSSKILFNIALIHATLGNHEVAVENYNASNALDQYLAVSYFQCGVSNFLLGRYEEARRDFEDAYLYLRGNMTIDYEQLGLKFRLYSCEVLFNKGISLIYMGREEEGMADLAEARREKQTPEHGVIDEAFEDRGDGYTVFSIPVGILYRPPANKVKNLKQKNYLGQAKLVAASDTRDAFTGFTGSQLAAKKLPSPTLVSSAGPGKELPDLGADGGAAGLSRSRTAGAADGLGDSVGSLRRRPTDNTATITPAGGSAPKPPQAQRSMTADPAPGRASSPKTAGTGRETQYVDELLDDYAEYPPPMPPVPQGQPKDRVANWAAQNARPGAAGGPGPAPRPPPTATTEVTRRGTSRRGYGGSSDFRRAASTKGARSVRGYDEYDDEGFEEDGLTSFTGGVKEMRKIRIKIQYSGDTRGMSITPLMTLDEFIDRLRAKFDLDAMPLMKFKDEDGGFVSIKDEDDWESAIDEARVAAKGKEEGKLEVTVVD